MIHRTAARRGTRRRGATTVEMAFVCSLLFLMLFGIFEYCRLLFVIHVSNNAARDAVRYAVVHTGNGGMPGDPVSVSQADLINITTYGTLVSGQQVGAGMCNMQGNIDAYNVNVFAVDPAGLSQTPPVVQPLPGTPASGWNAGAFGSKIAVQITGNYIPTVPALLGLNVSIPFNVTVMYSSEAN